MGPGGQDGADGDELSEGGRRVALARDVARTYSPGARTVLLCGSVARGWADRWSDVEVLVCWDRVPPPHVRAGLATAAGAVRRRTYDVATSTNVHEEDVVLRGIKVDLAHVATSDVVRVLDDVTRGCDPSPGKHALVAAVRDAVAMSGQDHLAGWQERAAVYPARLRSTMVARHLDLGPHRWLEMLADRDDVPLLHEVLSRVARSLLGTVLALNSTYAIGDSLKWALRVAAEQQIAPPELAARLRRVLTDSPREGVDEARALIVETVDLVRVHAPEVPLEHVMARFSSPGP